MAHTQPSPATGPPRWLVVVGSLAIGYHLLAVTLGALAAPSGPWPTPDGGGLSTPPQFAWSTNQVLSAEYLKEIKLAYHYHFGSNRPGAPDAFLEVRLKDSAGAELKTVRLPDSQANPWARFRQSVLARRLADDEPVPPPQSEVIAAPHRQVPSVQIWEPAEKGKLALVKKPVHLVPRDRPVFRPSDWSLLLARSYARHLCQVHGAATAEIVRHTHDPVPPAVLGEEGVPEDAFSELISNFGELPR
jgi:hypothetical protein